MKDIDELIRETLHDAKETPPAEVWETVSQRLTQTVSRGKAHRTRRWLALSATTVGIAVVAAVAIWQLKPAPEASDTLLSHNNILSNISDKVPPATHETTTPATELPTTANKPLTSEPHESHSVTAQTSIPSSFHETHMVQTQQPSPDAVAPATQPLPNAGTDITDPTPLETIQESTPTPSTTVAQSENRGQQTTEGKASSEKIVPELLIPSLLTPNGDGINDCWVIPGLEQYGHAQVQIYTAQSQRVYSSNDYRNDFCGNGLPEGNYFYVLVLRDYNYSRRGVFVIRK